MVFGRVVGGEEFVQAMEREGSGGGSCRRRVTIANCGEVSAKTKAA